MFVEKDNREEAAHHINDDLEKISLRAREWLVTVSPPMTKSLTISYKPNAYLHPDLTLDGHVIKCYIINISALLLLKILYGTATLMTL